MAKKPKSIRVDESEWESFIALCNSESTTATEQIEAFIRRCLDVGLPTTDEAIASPRLDERIAARIDAQMSENLELLLSELSALRSRVEAIEQQEDEMQGKLVA